MLPGVSGVSAQTPPDPALPVVTLSLTGSSGLGGGHRGNVHPHRVDYTVRRAEKNGSLTFRVHVDPPQPAALSVSVAAVQGAHFLAAADQAAKTVTVNANASGANFTLNTEDDSVDEGNDFVVVEIQPGSGYVVGGSRSYRGLYFYDNDEPGYRTAPSVSDRLELRLSRSSGEEGEGYLKVKLVKSFNADVDYRICRSTNSGRADAAPGADYDLVSWRSGRAETWTAAGCVVGLNTARDNQWWLKVWDDSAVESAETVKLELFEDADLLGTALRPWPSGVTSPDAAALVFTIVDNDAVVSPQAAAPAPVVSLRADAVSVPEGGVVSFTVSAVPAPVSDLVVNVFAEEESGGGLGFRGVGHRAEVTVPAGAGSVSWAFASMSDDEDHPDGSVEARVDPPAVHGSYVVGDPSAAQVVVADDDDPPAPSADSVPPPALDAQLLADVRSYAAETRHGTLHVNRWKRVLEAFGAEDYPNLEPTTLDEARVHVDIGRPRWVPVLAHMAAVDAADPQPPPARGSVQVDAQVLATARAKAGETRHGAKHVNRWKRVLEAFGDGDYPGIEPLTAAGAQVYANVWPAWTQVAAQIRLIEAAATTDPPPATVPPPVVVPPVVVPPPVVDPPPVIPPTPEVSITAGAGVTEGGSATFTVTASPAPASDLDVTVTVAQSGDYGAATGTRTVTIPSSGSVSFAVATSDDSADEPDGSVTATVDAAGGYTVSAAHGAGTVAVADNDDPPPASSVTVSVGDATGSEAGGVVEFTVSLSGASSEQVRVWFSTSNWRGLSGRAKMWLDYWTAQQTVVFAPGQTERTVSVWLVDDSRPEPDEHFTVTLTNPRGAAIDRGAATGTITDDD